VLGPVRTAAAVAAQVSGRGLRDDFDVSALHNSHPHEFRKWILAVYGNRDASAMDWGSFAVEDSLAGARSCGNHVCRKAVFNQGRLAKLGLSRSCY
jgi:hypothetical protein